MSAQTANAFKPSWDIPDAVASGVKFAPCRLAHGNIFVNELEPALQFYDSVCGFREVARELGINAGIFTNGNTPPRPRYRADHGRRQRYERPRRSFADPEMARP